MPRTTTDTSIPPPLRALGGWPDADWFCPTILTEDEVVGITLPKLAGSRKQTFHLVERTALQSAAAKKRPAPSGPPAKRLAANIGQLLDGLGVLRAAAFRKPSFFFEGAPALYFAEIPAANLKVRAADTLRRALIEHGCRGCIVRQQPKSFTAMLWPRAEADITAFVGAAGPPFPLHPQFDEPELAPVAGRAAKPARAAARDTAADSGRAERDRLLHELQALRSRIAELQGSQSALGAMETLGLDDARLKSMLLLLHPDRHANSEAANEAAKWVNGLRDMLRASRASAR